jgi:hypothetical protein
LREGNRTEKRGEKKSGNTNGGQLHGLFILAPGAFSGKPVET